MWIFFFFETHNRTIVSRSVHVYLETTTVIIGETLISVIKFSIGIPYSALEVREERGN
jgi:hypothetical protein